MVENFDPKVEKKSDLDFQRNSDSERTHKDLEHSVSEVTVPGESDGEQIVDGDVIDDQFPRESPILNASETVSLVSADSSKSSQMPSGQSRVLPDDSRQLPSVQELQEQVKSEKSKGFFGKTGGQKKRRSRALVVVTIVLVTLAALLWGLIFADTVLRNYAQDRIKSELSQRLPGTMRDDMTVKVGGESVIAQYLSGKFDMISVAIPQLSVEGFSTSLDFVATDVPVDKSKTIGHVEGHVVLDEKVVNAMLRKLGQNKIVTLQKGFLNYGEKIKLAGINLGYTVKAKAEARDTRIDLITESIKVDFADSKIDVSRVVEGYIGGHPVSVCVATQLPAGVSISHVFVSPGKVRVDLQSDSLGLNQEALNKKGVCTS